MLRRYLGFDSPGRTRQCITVLHTIIWFIKVCTVDGFDNVLTVLVHTYCNRSSHTCISKSRLGYETYTSLSLSQTYSSLNNDHADLQCDMNIVTSFPLDCLHEFGLGQDWHFCFSLFFYFFIFWLRVLG